MRCVLSFFCSQPANAKLSWLGTGAVGSGSILGRSNSKGIKRAEEKGLAFVSHLQRVGPSKKSSRKSAQSDRAWKANEPPWM